MKERAWSYLKGRVLLTGASGTIGRLDSMAFALTFLSDVVGAGVSLLDGLRVWQDHLMAVSR
jgi:hypothetical protein